MHSYLDIAQNPFAASRRSLDSHVAAGVRLRPNVQRDPSTFPHFNAAGGYLCIELNVRKPSRLDGDQCQQHGVPNANPGGWFPPGAPLRANVRFPPMSDVSPESPT